MRRRDSEERERLVDAFTRVASERGYGQTEVDEVTAVAGLPGSAFGEHFPAKRQCMLAAYDNFFDRLIGEVEDSMDLEASWSQQVSAAVEAGLGFVTESFAAARLFAVEALCLGPPAIDRYGEALRRISALLGHRRERSAEAAALPALTEAVLIAGVASLVTTALLSEDQARIPELAPRLTEVLLLPYAGTAPLHSAA